MQKRRQLLCLSFGRGGGGDIQRSCPEKVSFDPITLLHVKWEKAIPIWLLEDRRQFLKPNELLSTVYTLSVESHGRLTNLLKKKIIHCTFLRELDERTRTKTREED